MLFTKQIIRPLSYPVTNYVNKASNYVNKTFNRKISNSYYRSEDYNMFSTTFKVVTSIILSTIHLSNLINNNHKITLDRINKIEKTLENNN
jgi:hypothetical protein